jgi:hypothetical protein
LIGIVAPVTMDVTNNPVIILVFIPYTPLPLFL